MADDSDEKTRELAKKLVGAPMIPYRNKPTPKQERDAEPPVDYDRKIAEAINKLFRPDWATSIADIASGAINESPTAKPVAQRAVKAVSDYANWTQRDHSSSLPEPVRRALDALTPATDYLKRGMYPRQPTSFTRELPASEEEMAAETAARAGNTR